MLHPPPSKINTTRRYLRAGLPGVPEVTSRPDPPWSHPTPHYATKSAKVEGLGERTKIAGKEAYLQRYPEGCNAYVVHRPNTAATDVNEVFFVGMRAPLLDPERRCALAIELATAVDDNLPEP